MQSNQYVTSGSPVTDNKKTSFSPRELIMYHIANPDKPITADDIRNLNLKKYRTIELLEEESVTG